MPTIYSAPFWDRLSTLKQKKGSVLFILINLLKKRHYYYCFVVTQKKKNLAISKWEEGGLARWAMVTQATGTVFFLKQDGLTTGGSRSLKAGFLPPPPNPTCLPAFFSFRLF